MHYIHVHKYHRARAHTIVEAWEMFYLTTHSTHFIYGYMASDIWLRTILIVRKETRCRHIGYSYRLTARVLLYAPSHRQDNTYHGLCYTSRGALAGTRNDSIGPPHEGSIRRPIAPWANTLPLRYVPLLIVEADTWHYITDITVDRQLCLLVTCVRRDREEENTEMEIRVVSQQWDSQNLKERDVAQRYNVRSWCGGSSDRSFMGWTHWAISRSSQCSTTGVTKAVVCVILYVGWCI